MTFEMPKYRPLYLIQRLRMRNKDNQVPFEHRFEREYMGSKEFERGEMALRIRELNENCHVGEIMVNGVFMLAAWNPDRFAMGEVERELNRVLRGEQRTKEWTNFTDAYRRETRQLEKETGSKLSQSNPLTHRTNAWFDITNGVFWTWERCNISDIRKNFRLSVMEMDGTYVPKPAPPPPPKAIHPLRQRMIDEGRLHPTKES